MSKVQAPGGYVKLMRLTAVWRYLLRLEKKYPRMRTREDSRTKLRALIRNRVQCIRRVY